MSPLEPLGMFVGMAVETAKLAVADCSRQFRGEGGTAAMMDSASRGIASHATPFVALPYLSTELVVLVSPVQSASECSPLLQKRLSSEQLSITARKNSLHRCYYGLGRLGRIVAHTDLYKQS